MSNGWPVRDAWQHKVWSHGAQIHYPVPTSQNEPNRPFHASVEHCSWTLRTGRDGWTFAMLACSTDQMKLAPLLAGGKTNYFCHFISTHKGHEATLFSPACSPEQREMAEGKDCLFYSSFSKDCRKVTVLTSCSRAAPQLSVQLCLSGPCCAGKAVTRCRQAHFPQQPCTGQQGSSLSRQNHIWFAFNTKIFCPYKLA